MNKCARVAVVVHYHVIDVLTLMEDDEAKAQERAAEDDDEEKKRQKSGKPLGQFFSEPPLNDDPNGSLGATLLAALNSVTLQENTSMRKKI